MNSYNIRNYNRKRQWYRFRLGLIQMIHCPALFLTLLLPLLLAIILEIARKELSIAITPSTVLEPLFGGCLLFAVIIVPILLAMLILQGLGESVAKKVEGKISLCFDVKHLRYGAPILISHKYKASRHYYEFYSYIPMKVWQDRKDAFADMLDCRIIDIQYGKHGDRVVLTVAKGRKTKVEGRIYDEHL